MDMRIFKLLLLGLICSYQFPIASQAKHIPCRSRVSSDTMQETFCQLGEPDKDHNKLSCLRNEEVVITDVIQGIKSQAACTRQVIGHDNVIFCCKKQGSDILLDANCLRRMTHEEERERYTSALLSILSTCSQRRSCVLNYTTAMLIPRGVESVDKFAAYVEVAYTCYKEQSHKTTQISFCDAVTGNGSSVFLRSPDKYSVTADDSFNCSCSVTSASRIIVVALDVRLGTSESSCGDVQMVFANRTDQSYLTCEEDNVVFGSTTMMEGNQTVSIHLNRLHMSRVPSMVWLNISAIDGSQVIIVCTEPAHPQPSEIPPVPRIEANRETEYGFTYWSFVFGVVGVIGACCTMGIALAIFLTCRRRLRTRDEKYDLEPTYATVADYVHHSTPMRMSRNSLYSQKKSRNLSGDTYRSDCDSHDGYSISTLEKRPPIPPSPPPKTYDAYKRVKGGDSNKLTVDVAITPTKVEFIDSPTSDERLISENEDAEEEQVTENIMVTKL
ncbi:uncharacterized protein LOC121369778 [Gigantopelta aegis]|uniref:uncharacterized protein LOC121369778 n=1 Tax=Gigantopelta aegis TaxID=1735272 RepID=UPI001B88AF19|nr:uncharacterized protein LOC121369778 [Gigantopelta aegis]